MSDRLSPGELFSYHQHRKTLKHTYICQKCAHAFDTHKPVKNCIFCNGPVKEMERDDLPRSKVIYTHVCASCHKKFIAEKADHCIRCGSKFLHSYKTGKITTREVLSYRKNLLKQKMKKLFKKPKPNSK